nr:transposase [Rhizobium bangladeshense]
MLIAELPELGAIDDKKVAALVGFAPVAHDSGTWRGRHHIAGGRATVRRPLYSNALGHPLRPGHQSLPQTPAR